MYIRFVVNEKSEESGQKLGILHAVRYMYDDQEFSVIEAESISRVIDWLAENLESPLDHMNKQKLKKSETYISWFKATANIHINEIRVLASILKEKGVAVEALTTDRPGKIVYEDEFQIFSKPYKVF